MTDKPIELKNSPVCRVVGKIPPALVRYGIFLLVGITIALILILDMLKFPTSFRVEGRIMVNNEIELFVSDKTKLDEIQAGRRFALIYGNECIYHGFLGKRKNIFM